MVTIMPTSNFNIAMPSDSEVHNKPPPHAKPRDAHVRA